MGPLPDRIRAMRRSRRRSSLPSLAACTALMLGAGVAALPSAASAQPAVRPPEAVTTPRATPNCPSDEAVATLARNLLANRPSPLFTGMTSLEDGLCAQDKLVRVLQ